MAPTAASGPANAPTATATAGGVGNSGVTRARCVNARTAATDPGRAIVTLLARAARIRGRPDPVAGPPAGAASTTSTGGPATDTTLADVDGVGCARFDRDPASDEEPAEAPTPSATGAARTAATTPTAAGGLGATDGQGHSAATSTCAATSSPTSSGTSPFGRIRLLWEV
ncbi:hypothetical protein [Streptomyces sp. NPDC059122]|uniref:hypothetical protein n=1 Tax=Streptomyces sp. NPDC059122 TaxID=3346732 RepID=UPI0036AE7068